MKMVFQGKAALCLWWIQHCIFTGVEMTSPCSSGQLYYPTRGICYWLVPSMETFNDGESSCNSGGGHLANIPDQASLDFIIQEYGTTLEAHTERFIGYWIGVTDSAKEGVFQTMEGDPQTWTFWKGGDPNDNDIPPQDCVRMFPEETPAYAWQDRSCNEIGFSFCSKQLETTTSQEEIPTTTEPTTSDLTTTPSTTTTLFATTTESTTSDFTTTRSTTTTASTTTTEQTTTHLTTTTTEIPKTEEPTETTSEHASLFSTIDISNTTTVYTTEAQTPSVSIAVDVDSTTNDELSTHLYWKGTSTDVTQSTTDKTTTILAPEPKTDATMTPVCKGSGEASTKCCSDSKCEPKLSNLTCYCTCNPHLSVDDPIVIQKIQQLVEELTIPKKNTSVNRRKYISVVDNRPSARGLGYFGASILAAVIACIVLLDLSTVFRNIQHVTLQARRESTCNQTNWAIKIES